MDRLAAAEALAEYFYKPDHRVVTTDSSPGPQSESEEQNRG